MDKVAELLREYQDLFPTKFSDLKPDAKPVK